MIILGVDPGTLFTGYAVIECSRNLPVIIKADVIKLKQALPLQQRLKLIYDSLSEVISLYKPDHFAIETAFYGKNVQSTLKLGHARGVSMLAAANSNIIAVEYSPREVKKAIAGNGNASKYQVRYMLSHIFKSKKINASYDVSDAIAVAFCHHNKILSNPSMTLTWNDFIKKNPSRVLQRF